MRYMSHLETSKMKTMGNRNQTCTELRNENRKYSCTDGIVNAFADHLTNIYIGHKTTQQPETNTQKILKKLKTNYNMKKYFTLE